MAPLPKKKSTRGRSNRRRNRERLQLASLVKCASCGKLKEPHRACPYCGAYNNAGNSR